MDIAAQRSCVRELAKKVREIAEHPKQEEKITLWKKLNSINMVRPMVTIDQICWPEMNVDGELTLVCEDPYLRSVEDHLRKIIYQDKHMCADNVVRPFFNVPKAVRYDRTFGVSSAEESIVGESGIVAKHFDDVIKTEEDIAKITDPDWYYLEEQTQEAVERAQDLLGDILIVRPMGYTFISWAWDLISTLKSVEGALYDMIDRPEFMHKLVERITEAELAQLDMMEERGLLEYDQDRIHCTGAYTDELPAEGFNPDKPRAKDIWCFGLAQMLSTVSPDMFDEFEVRYQNRIFERFGLVYYGCCDPLDTKMEQVRKLKNVRKVSMSPWVNIERGAAEIGRDYVLSRKPNPALLAAEVFSEDEIRKEISDTLKACERNGCSVEFILKDLSTVKCQPQRLWRWNEIVVEMVK